MKLLLLLIFGYVGFCQTGHIESNGSLLYYQTFGEGNPLLIINGGPGMDSDGFVPLAKNLSKTNRAIVYDQRGTGKSRLKTVSSSTITMDLMVDDIEHLRKHLGYEKWTILGHSFGGMLASYYAAYHPDRVDRMILSASGGIDLGLTSYVSQLINAKLSKQQRDSLAYWNSKISAGDTSYVARIGRGRSLAPAYVYNQKNAFIIAERLTHGNSRINSLVWQDLSRINFNCAPLLRNFDKKVLIIHGKNDILGQETADAIKNCFQNSSLVVLDKCGHYGWLDRPEQYFIEIDKFLNTI